MSCCPRDAHFHHKKKLKFDPQLKLITHSLQDSLSPNITMDTTSAEITTTTRAPTTTTTTAEDQVVLLSGGYHSGVRLSSTEVYPQISGCSPPSLPTATSSHALFMTTGTNPRVASCGGVSSGAYLDSCLVWDSDHQRWDEDMMSSLLQARAYHYD